MSTITTTRGTRTSRAVNILLWSAQVLLALLFLFAGVAKLRMGGAVLARFTGLPGAFMVFIAVAEIAGALGLVLPGLFRVKRLLTPVAAVGLVTIMAGATTVMAAAGQAGAFMPFTVGIVAALVAHGRRGWLTGARRDPPDRLSWRRKLHQSAGRFACVRNAVSGSPRHPGLGRAVLARRPPAGPAAAEAGALTAAVDRAAVRSTH